MLGDERMGVGVAVAPRAVLTAHYLVMGASSVHVGAFDGRERTVREAAVDHETGFALLHLDGPELRPSPLAPTGRLAAGAPVFLLTCQDENERKGASGHVMVVGPFEAFWEYMLDQAIMTTVVNPGLAGAPLFDALGRLVGVVSLGLSAVGRYSLAIPIDLYLERREEMESGRTLPGPARAGLGRASTRRPSTAGSRSRASWPGDPRTRPASPAATCSSRWTDRPSGPSAISTRRSGARARATPSASRCCASPRSSWSK